MMEDHSKKKKLVSVEDAVKKAYKYCAYQERSKQEVRDKLYDLGLHKKEVEQTISLLISGGFLNEERFAIAYAGGKFRIKHWGRVKIKYALKQKKLSDYCIRMAISQIGESDYLNILKAVINSYSKKVKETDAQKRNYRIAQHAVSKGFEADLVWEVLQNKEW